LREQNGLSNFSNGIPSQNAVETRFTTTIKIHENLAMQSSHYSDKVVVVSQNGFAISKVKP